ncbi:hypothetical protein Tco_1439063 [Tanacetum coccineum]
MGETVKDMSAKFRKLDKFKGSDCRRWQKKIHFLLTTLKVVYVLSTHMPEFVEVKMLDQTRRRCKWENDDHICRRHILNGVSDALFDVLMEQYHELLRILGQFTQHGLKMDESISLSSIIDKLPPS